QPLVMNTFDSARFSYAARTSQCVHRGIDESEKYGLRRNLRWRVAGVRNDGPGDGRHGLGQLVHPRHVRAGDDGLPSRPKAGAIGPESAGTESSSSRAAEAIGLPSVDGSHATTS